MVLVEQQPRRYTVCWSVIGGLLLLLSLYALVSEGRNGPWVLPLALSFPMFVGAAQGISKTMSMEMGRIIVWRVLGHWGLARVCDNSDISLHRNLRLCWCLDPLWAFLYLRFCGQFLEIYSVASEGILGFGNWPFNNVLSESGSDAATRFSRWEELGRPVPIEPVAPR